MSFTKRIHWLLHLFLFIGLGVFSPSFPTLPLSVPGSLIHWVHAQENFGPSHKYKTQDKNPQKTKTNSKTVFLPDLELTDEDISPAMKTKVIPRSILKSSKTPSPSSKQPHTTNPPPNMKTSGSRKGNANRHTGTHPEVAMNVLRRKTKITGSHIKKSDTKGLSYIFTLEKEDMEKTGYNSVADVLRDLPLNSFGSSREIPGSLTPGFSGVNLRGLGTMRTLILINGKRGQKDSLTNSVDLNLIPFAAVEKIEILKGSASAIYGSDALGGVVNIITRDKPNGHEASAKYFMSEEPGGNQTEVSLASGYSSPQFKVNGVLYHRSNEMIYARDRKHSHLDLSHDGPPGTFRILREDASPYFESDGQTVAQRSQYQAAPGCPPDRILATYGGQVCLYNNANHQSLRPSLNQTSLLLQAQLDLSRRLNTFAHFMGTHRKVNWVLSPSSAGSASGVNILGQMAKAYATHSGQTFNKAFAELKSNDVVNLHYRLVELGNRLSEVTSLQYNSLIGMTLQTQRFGEVEISGGYNESYRESLGLNGYAQMDALEAHIESLTFNPFAPVGQRGELYSLNYKTYTTSKTELSFAEISATGEAIQTSTGPIGLALGLQTYIERFHVDTDEATKSGDVIGGIGSALNSDRSVFSGYIELSIPLSTSIEWSLAARQSSYSDFGQAFTPQTSLHWQITPHVMIHSSVGRSFKAPNMSDLYTTSSQGYQTFIDRKLCEQNSGHECLPQPWLVRSGGNPHLKEERSFSANVGTVIKPTSHFAMGLEAWYLNLKNQVGINYEDITKAESLFKSNYVERFGIHIDRNPLTGEIQSMTAPIQNLHETELSGVDLSTTLSLPTGLGLWALSLQHSHILSYSFAGFPGLEKKSKLGQNGYPSWRNTLAITYAPMASQSISLVFRTISNHEKTLKEAGRLQQYTEIDLQYSYNGTWGGVISAGLRNLLGSTPPIDDSNPLAPRISHHLYDGNGRIGWIHYKQTF